MKFYKYNNLFDEDLSVIPERGKLISTINQYSFCLAENDPDFLESLKGSDVLLPDGEGVVWAANYLEGKKIRKIAGEDLFYFFMRYLEQQKGSCFFLGSSEETLNLIVKRAKRDFPHVRVGTYSPPFKQVFTDLDSEKMKQQVNSFNADVLFVGMTAPKQEKWAFKYHDDLKVSYICCIGAVFDFYAQTIKRPNKIWIKLRLEWLARLIKEPKRMWTRYVEFGPVFINRIFEIKKQMQ
ncbi:WecB/TagA/CpsF family glycosyltransferase [Lunatibacter salilacus]|uniref:WecB/TagA/CpsF family glycosyltransferase n=1 Tax=Lunatibacter salilacus TaxID=2483804 RepID=UPI00131E31CA|nr:WecB/TagA/CpsF family glycosyltransferase [Lunatibacter salilacus]